jgi:hypothetical protein
MQAAALSRIFFMEVPRYRRHRQQPNNVASIWLLRGTAKTRLFAGCSSRATARFVPRLAVFLAAIIQFGRNQAPKGFVFPIQAR